MIRTTCAPHLLRIEDVDTAPVLPQILRLRALAGRRVSLAPDLSPWLDPCDARAMHWGVFFDAELVATARLCLYASLDEVADGALFRSVPAKPIGPVAVMSHCIVHPRLQALRLEGVLDAVRIERARQLHLPCVLAVTDSARRAAALEAQGFVAQGLGADAPGADGASAAGRRGLVLWLASEPRGSIVRMRAPSRR